MDVRCAAAVALVLWLAARPLTADVGVMKDVTLGFGEALEKCRQEVGSE